MHIERVKNNSSDYLRLVEGYADVTNAGYKQKKRILLNIGPYARFDDGKPNYMERLRQSFRDGQCLIPVLNDYIKNNKQSMVTISFDLNNSEDYESNYKNLGFFFLDALFDKLGINDVLTKEKSKAKITYDVVGIAKNLIFNRVLNPNSKYKTYQDQDKYIFPVVKCTDWHEYYRSLSVINRVSESIMKRMNYRIANSSIGRNNDLMFYDVTNYYFETMYGDNDIYQYDENGVLLLDDKNKLIINESGLRKKGVSKEKRSEPIVQMGLFIDNQGIPVSYKLFPGNTNDKFTFKTVIADLDKQESKVIVVADNGVYSGETQNTLVEQQNGYIISKSVKKSWTKFKEWALNNEDYEHKENSDGIITFKSKSRINKINYLDKNGQPKTRYEKEIIFWSKKQYDLEVKQNQEFINYLESCKNNPYKLKDKQRKSQEFIKVLQTDKATGEILKTRPLVILLDEKIKKYQETMGFYAIITSETEMSDSEVINRYHGLSRIEDSFRVIKGELEGRPVYVRTKEHINAHFLICFIALTMIRIIQFNVLRYQKKDTLNVDGWSQGITAEKLKTSLESFTADKLPGGYYRLSKQDENIKLLFEITKIESDIRLPTYKDIKELKLKVDKSFLM